MNAQRRSEKPDKSSASNRKSGVLGPLSVASAISVVPAAVVGIMVGCIAISVARLARLLAEMVGTSAGLTLSAWRPAYFFVACLLAALEAYYGRRWTESLEGAELWRFRATQILAFFVLLKVGSYLGTPWADVQADILIWMRHPLQIFNTQVYLALALSFLAWFASTQTIRDLERLEEPLQFSRDALPGVPRPPPLRSLSSRFFWGGAVLLIVAGISRVGIALLLDLERPPVPGLVLNVLVYFLLGLFMLGQVRFVALRKEWRGQKAEVASELGRQWIRYCLAFIGLAAVVAFLLPTGYTTYLLDILAVVLGVVVQILYVLGAVLAFLVSLPFWLLARLFMRDEAPPPPSANLPLAPPAQPDLDRAPPDWLGVARAVFFWVVALGIAFYLVRGFLREHPEIWRAIASFGPLRWLRGLWQALRRRFRRLEALIRERLPGRGKTTGTASLGELARDSRFRWRSNRGRVLYYYLNVVRRAGKVGYVRRVSQTPDEYSAVLERDLTEAREDVAFLTEVFTEARYSRHPIAPALVRRARAGWRRMKHNLRILAHPTRTRDVRTRTRDVRARTPSGHGTSVRGGSPSDDAAHRGD